MTKIFSRMDLKSEKIEPTLDSSIVKEEYASEREAPSEKPSLTPLKSEELETFQCPQCPKTFGLKRNMKQHLKVHSSIKPYSCSVCKNKFKTLQYRNRHMKRHSEGLKYKCERCDLEFVSYAQKSRHVEKVHKGDPYVCKICKKGFTSIQYLRQHELRHTSKIECLYCNKTLVCRQYLLRHIKNLHRGLPYKITKKGPLSCTVCSKSFSNLDNLKEHAEIHANERPFECAICGNNFTSKQRVAVHITNIHLLTTNKSLPCLQCNKTFRRTVTFLAHQEEIHNNRRPFGCHLCSSQYRHQSHLAKHMKTHEENRLGYTCKECGLVLQYKKSLRNHERMHDREAGDSTCSFCKKFFTYKSQLLAHVERYHRYLQCPYCEKKPGSQKFLDEHIRQQHKNPVKIKKEANDKAESVGVDMEILSSIKKEIDDSFTIKTMDPEEIKKEVDVETAVNDLMILSRIKTEIDDSITIKTETN